MSSPPPPTPPAANAAPGDVAQLLDERPAQAWYRRPLLWAAVVLLATAVAAAAWWQRQRTAAATPSYSTQAVTRGDLTLTVTANGTVQPTRTLSIGSELSGTVRKVNVDVNDRIRKGQVLVELDSARLHDQTLRAQAAVAAAQARLAQTAATVGEARAGLGRMEEVSRLSGGKVPSRAEMDGSRAALARALADESGARAGISDAQAALSTERINLGKASIVAPADGMVLTRSVDPGNAVAASLQAVTLFTVAEDLSRLRLWVYVDEADVGAVKAGQEASFSVSAFPGRPFPARVTRVGFGSTITDNVVTYLTHLEVDNADLSLRPGMTVTAAIVATRRSGVLLVPNPALRFAPAAPAAAAARKNVTAGLLIGPPRTPRRSAAGSASTAAARQVWVLRDGVPVAVPVTPGISDGRMTEIVAGELREGMAVITHQNAAAAP